MKTTPIFALFLLLILAVQAQAQTNQGEQIPTLSYDELMRNKDLYLEKTVRLKAFWYYGFEYNILCGESDCKFETWVWFTVTETLCRGSKGNLKKASNNRNNRAEVVFHGKLSSGSFGHLGAYRYQFTVSCVERLKRLSVDLKKLRS